MSIYNIAREYFWRPEFDQIVEFKELKNEYEQIKKSRGDFVAAMFVRDSYNEMLKNLENSKNG